MIYKKLLVAVLLLLATAEFVVRGPIRYYRTGFGWSDMTQVYVPARAWVKGLNPYNPKEFVAVCREATGESQDEGNIRTHSPYPITTLVVIAPIATLPWRLAHPLWAVLLGVSAIPMILALLSLSSLSDPLWQWLFAALTLALAPLQTGVAAGNVSLLAIVLCSGALCASEFGNDLLAGVLLALGVCLKPQLGIGFALYYALAKRWRVVLVSGFLSLLILVVGILRLWLSGAHWLRDFVANAQGFAIQNRLVDFTEADPLRFTLVNLQVLLYSILGSRLAAQYLALLLGFVLSLIWIYLGFWKRAGHPKLLVLSAMVVLSLLPVYHRNYDATLLVFPLCWSLSDYANTRGRIGTISLALLLPFAIPGPALLQSIVEHGRLPVWIARAWWWNIFVMPHEIWLLLAISVLLLIWLSRSQGETARPPLQEIALGVAR